MNEFDSPLAAFLFWENKTPNQIFLKQPNKGILKTYTYKQAGEEIRKIAHKLIDFNFEKKSHIALLSKNCAQWLISDLAISMANHVSIPIYPSLNDESINQILVHSESKAIIVGKLDNYESQKQGIPKIPIIGMKEYGINEKISWEDIVSKELKEIELPKLDSSELHTIIYTSGTTGTPKGVMHTIGNFMNSINTLTPVLNLCKHPRFFSYLPLAHVAERLIWTYALSLGGSLRFPDSLATFATDLEETQPQAFFAVPRIWTKFQEKILEKIPQKKLSFLLSIPILNKIIKSKLQKKLGLKECQIAISAAAPLAKDVIDWYSTIGIEVLQVYGMTEDCCISHFNIKKANKVGTVGKALPGVKVKFSTDSEILIKNESLFKGYYKSPETTAEVLREDGYFHTGDSGEYDHDGFLTITGRVKDLFKTDKGKYISPSHMELEFSDNLDIDQICIVGTGIPQPIALVVISEKAKLKSKEELSQSLLNTVSQVNPLFEKHEKIEKVVVMSEDWTVDNGLLTPTLKVKRNRIEKIHQGFYKSWFLSEDKVVFEP